MFGIFDLPFTKIVVPTIFVRESFIVAANFLRVARAPVAFRRWPPSRPSPRIVSPVAVWWRSDWTRGFHDLAWSTSMEVYSSLLACVAAASTPSRYQYPSRRGQTRGGGREYTRGGQRGNARQEDSHTYRVKHPRREE